MQEAILAQRELLFGPQINNYHWVQSFHPVSVYVATSLFNANVFGSLIDAGMAPPVRATWRCESLARLTAPA